MTPPSSPDPPAEAIGSPPRPPRRWAERRSRNQPPHRSSLAPGPLLLALLLLPAGALSAQPYEVDWHATDAGGGTSSGAEYSLTASIGQPDTGTISGGTYQVEAGFWPGLILMPAVQVPTLTLRLVGDQLWIAWWPAAAGFRLEQTADLTSPRWVPVSSINPTNLPLAANAQFYRLIRP